MFFAQFRLWNKTTLNLRRRAGQGWARAAGSALHGGGEALEEIVGELLGRTIDQPLAELRQLAADLRLDVVGEQRAAVLVRQGDRGAALGEARNPAIALAGNLVAVRRIEVGEPDLAFEAP